jgi:hypothetical protein
MRIKQPRFFKRSDVPHWDCAKCSKWKPATSFSKRARAHNGLNGVCKDCVRQGRPTRRGRQGWTYIVKAETLGVYKIGFAVDIPSRLMALRNGSPDRLVLVAKVADDRERRWHSWLKASRLHGEWFRESGRLIDLVKHYGTADIKPRHLYKRALVTPVELPHFSVVGKQGAEDEQ